MLVLSGSQKINDDCTAKFLRVMNVKDNKTEGKENTEKCYTFLNSGGEGEYTHIKFVYLNQKT